MAMVLKRLSAAGWLTPRGKYERGPEIEYPCYAMLLVLMAGGALSRAISSPAGVMGSAEAFFEHVQKRPGR
jgi:hypothetical protein